MKPAESNLARRAPGLDRQVALPGQPPPRSLEARLLRGLLRSMGTPAFRVTLWNGEQVGDDPNPLVPHLLIHRRSALYRLLLDPALHFGDAYAAGEVDIEGSLVDFVESCYRGEAHSRRLLLKAYGRTYARRNPPGRSRHNVHHHYDIGNAFYRLWLDEQLLYTCAYFPDPAMTLEQAQLAKMDHVCRKLRLRPGESVVEAGCGWGALALHMARRYGVRVRAFNLSREQIAYARQRAAAEGLAGRVEFVEDDYRNIDGRHDAFVSVGMLEHVGPDHYRELGGVVDHCLAERGRGLIHTIGRNRPMPMNGWIEKRIFPGAYPPSLREMMEIFEPWEFSVLDVENLRLHYARTLEHWLARFERSADEVRRMFDERFVRTWRLYLSGSVAGFTSGQMQLFQVLFARAGNNDIPLTRSDIYRPE